MKWSWRLILIGLLFCGLVFSSVSIAEEGKWTRKADMPIAVASHSLSAVNGKIYVIGGIYGLWNLNIKTFSTLYEYDPKADIWSRKADMSTPRTSHRTCVIDGKIYAVGGWTDGDFTNAIEAYDPITDRWEKKADMPTKRGESAVDQVNGRIYVMGGHNKHSGVCLSIVEEYNPKTNTWTKKNDMPTARSFATNCAVNGKIYLIGGANDNNFPNAKFLTTVEIYDPSTDTWTKGSDIPTPRITSASFAVNGMIYVMGGTSKSFSILSTVEIYDTKNDTWTKGESMPVARDSMASYPMVDGKFYAIGGYGSSLNTLSDAWEYDTGFRDNLTSVDAKGKLTTTWGEIRRTK